jgi:hypothetical protein
VGVGMVEAGCFRERSLLGEVRFGTLRWPARGRDHPSNNAALADLQPSGEQRSSPGSPPALCTFIYVADCLSVQEDVEARIVFQGVVGRAF